MGSVNSGLLPLRLAVRERLWQGHAVFIASNHRYSPSLDSSSWVSYSTLEVVQTVIESGSGIGSIQVGPTFILEHRTKTDAWCQAHLFR